MWEGNAHSLLPLKPAHVVSQLPNNEQRQFVSMINIGDVGGRAYV